LIHYITSGAGSLGCATLVTFSFTFRSIILLPSNPPGISVEIDGFGVCNLATFQGGAMLVPHPQHLIF
ncbi:hypothetical protein T10_5327, partial [Trichinella papuae]